MAEIEVLPQKIVDTKTLVLKSRLDSNWAKLQGEKLKRKFFVRLGFLKPNIEDIKLVGFEKYYEPYIVIGGKYSIDYCRKHVYAVKVEEQTREIFVGGKKFRTEPVMADNSLDRVIRLEGEENAHYQNETYFILDRFRREVSPNEFAFAPREDLLEDLSDVNLSLRNIDSSLEADIDFLRSKIAKRPPDVAEIIREIFEINERTIIYIPVYALTFQNIKSGKEVTLQIDGISGKMVLQKFYKRNTSRLLGKAIETFREDSSTDQPNSFRSESEQWLMGKSSNELKGNTQNSSIDDSGESGEPSNHNSSEKDRTLDFSGYVRGEIFRVGDNITAVVGDLEIPSGTDVHELLVVKGTLKIGDKCRMTKKLKALGDIIVGSETVIEDGMVAGGNVIIGAKSVIRGSIKATGIIEIKEAIIDEKDFHVASVDTKESVDLTFFADIEKDQSVVSSEE